MGRAGRYTSHQCESLGEFCKTMFSFLDIAYQLFVIPICTSAETNKNKLFS